MNPDKTDISEQNQKKYKDISGIILSGGKSLRMGTDKALLKIGNKTIIERAVHLMSSLFQKILIITNNPSHYQFLEVQLFEDIIENKGPISGIHTGLSRSKTEKNFIISCDLPLMSSDMINYIIEYESEKPVKYCFVSNRHHYLAGVYSRSILPEIEKIFLLDDKSSVEKQKFYSIKYLINNIDPEVINPEGLSFYKPDLFFNLNSPEDFEYLRKKMLSG